MAILRERLPCLATPTGACEGHPWTLEPVDALRVNGHMRLYAPEQKLSEWSVEPDHESDGLDCGADRAQLD